MHHNRPPELVDSALTELEEHNEFVRRHIGPGTQQIEAMLALCGAASLEDLVAQTLPEDIQTSGTLDLPRARNERETLERLRSMADKNQVLHNMIGLGYHDTILPAVIQRNVLENPGWYTAYTPYQAEISQGRLEALLNFQQMVCDLTAMPIANASLLDEATAAAEAMTMLQRVNRKNKSKRFFIDQAVLPQTRDVVSERAKHFGIEVVSGAITEARSIGEFFAVLLQYPGRDGGLLDLQPLIQQAHSENTLVAVAADLLSLLLLKPPGEYAADVVIGSAQRFGVPPGYGGPHAAFFATQEAYKRAIPGRIIGVSKDRHNRPALRMAMQTREQHIRRDKATSNICTAQALLANISSLYAAYHGPQGLLRIARRVHRLTQLLQRGLQVLGFEPQHQHFFDTLSYAVDSTTGQNIFQAAQQAGINLLYRDGQLGLSVNEQTTRDHISTLLEIFATEQPSPDLISLDQQLEADADAILPGLLRQSDYLTHPVFNSYHSETEMLRYLKRLENRDLSLTHAMIPLGSCTMKLNATTEMIPISWPEFSALHPFAPQEQTQGYRQLFLELEEMLRACTGYAAVSLQPNAGSQGEYAGLLAIKRFHAANGQGHRDICLIPSSAHGTNPASAAMAGMRIIVVACDEAGNVDVADLRNKAETHSQNLAALMITYPSTHGVYEQAIREICAIVHEHGGQIYLDGANLNALVGCAAPGEFGADVSHLNLHKTFCIPHGGGGPGVGPICAGAHLQPYFPGHSLVKLGRSHDENPAVAAAPWGSAGILPISWAYIAMMGRDGMKLATQVAILSANYIAVRLADSYDVLYTGRNHRVAHECIIDLRPFKESAGISEEDVAKRLIDYGFHAPTMSFPVPGTLMIEPTESESKAEIDRFIEALLSIREEIRAIEQGQSDPADNLLKNAPHNLRDLAADDWPFPYSRAQACYPSIDLWQAKYFPPSSRVDNVYGDRNLICSCPPPEAYADLEGDLKQAS